MPEPWRRSFREADEMTVSVLWFRRDLRLDDHPALAKAAKGGSVLPLFVVDPALMGPAGLPRRVFLIRTLRDLDRRLRGLGAELIVRSGRPEEVLPEVVVGAGATEVHISADFAPYGSARDLRVAGALGSIPLVPTGSPYAVSPPRLRTTAGHPYKVFAPFLRAWRAHGWPRPAACDARTVEWVTALSDAWPDDPSVPAGVELPAAGEEAALDAWSCFKEARLSDYRARRDRPDLDGTSRLSPHLHLGALHPRTLLSQLGPDDHRFLTELAWREFYGAILWSWPQSARENFDARMNGLAVDRGPAADALYEAWCEGRTGYPIIDAGMRQLRAQAWMHNRVRMLVASFLVKDLHLDWRRGARHFMRHLVDGDLASNQHGWQWAAGTGTDASPYFRIFNPVTQSKRFDPDGNYIRRWVPELRAVPVQFVHEPWRSANAPDYPSPIVDHGVERQRSLADFAALRAPTPLSGPAEGRHR
jgi:deoxyribodipyrimidine photo-lyase